MAPKIGPKVATLQGLLSCIGALSSGRKDALITRLSRDLKRPLLPSASKSNRPIRILSIDMGIKNLAFCVADIKARDTQNDPTEMEFQAWRRFDVAEEVLKTNHIREPIKEKAQEHTEFRDDRANEDSDAELYSPSTLSEAAHALVTKTLLPFRPDIILIERQRWRSSSSSAIQQWTLRVNLLEGMLWAVLKTMRGSQDKPTSNRIWHEYEIFSVDPKRVAHFWVEPTINDVVASPRKKSRVKDESIVSDDLEDGDCIGTAREETVKKISRGKVEKKAKIQLLRSWLDTKNPSIISNPNKFGVAPDVDFRFSGEASTTSQALVAAGKKKTTGKGAITDFNGVDLRKVDDVTDCFLQAAAWVVWEKNRHHLLQKWDGKSFEGFDEPVKPKATKAKAARSPRTKKARA
ncbi:ribonuclease H-like protein [Corynespora cassiicola Philippines]|uniref:Ribonuclease H-like protein n=1 Tax=Corynespora cassiicola Philippines TaxID=1448308 RepID=A0A2T2NF23_CORCC|nr:ribonuclease H-like protein [Corynespora cassiicola Philippines]